LHDLGAEPLGDLVDGRCVNIRMPAASAQLFLKLPLPRPPENNRQPEQDDCNRHQRRAGDVSDQDEDDRDDGEDCCDVVTQAPAPVEEDACLKRPLQN
jgi:hypothetical protein